MATKTTNTTNEVAEKTEANTKHTVELLTFDVELANGRKVTLEAIKNQADYPLEAGVRAQRGEVLAFLDLVLTQRARWVLYNAGATMIDYDTVSSALGEANGAIEDDE
ncbi:hypothetical protein [Corynebacterium aurimucosum]|uniref:hypothetical protein n=1 Tax=Corynebacterium aurimucosum TaxID=169292 RepID=UPI0018797F8F|nr:hypothetical protein [Corynebacterium aurimucosum]MBE7338126.1 hypothetical protein [Corynebacterium aurimucosum]